MTAVKRRHVKEALSGYSFILPQMLGYIMFVLYPLVMVFNYALQNRRLFRQTYAYIGINNFIKAFNTPMFYTTLKNTLIFSACYVPIHITLALMFAFYLGKRKFGHPYVKLIIFLPIVTSGVAWSLVWRYLLQMTGPLNSFLSMIGIQGPNWLNETGWAMAAIVASRLIKALGTNVLIFTGAVMNMQSSLSESARIDGANGWKLFWHIELPQLMPSLLMVTMVTVIGSMRVFDSIKLMTDGGPQGSTMVLVYHIYKQAFVSGNIGYGSALSVILLVIALLLTIIQWSVRRRVSYNED